MLPGPQRGLMVGARSQHDVRCLTDPTAAAEPDFAPGSADLQVRGDDGQRRTPELLGRSNRLIGDKPKPRHRRAWDEPHRRHPGNGSRAVTYEVCQREAAEGPACQKGGVSSTRCHQPTSTVTEYDESTREWGRQRRGTARVRRAPWELRTPVNEGPSDFSGHQLIRDTSCSSRPPGSCVLLMSLYADVTS